MEVKEKARNIYEENKDVVINDRTWIDVVLEGFEKLRKRGINHPDMSKIEEMIRKSEYR